MKRLFILFLFSAFAAPLAAHAQLPPVWVKSNLLWDATGTVNLGVEMRLGGRTSLDVPFNYNAWSWSETRKWKHLGVQPELRFWPHRTFDGHFFGLHGHWATYNVAGLPFNDYMKSHRFEGWLAGAGISYGYRWNFRNPRWALEATVGVGYAYLDYDKFACGDCGADKGHRSKHYFGPTRAGVSLMVGLGRYQTVAPPVHVEPVIPPVIEIPVVVPAPRPRYVMPVAEVIKQRALTGSARLEFVVARHEILPTFRGNAAELEKIHNSIESVRDDRYATITGITIVGHASPEGGWASNLALSERRAVALKNHVRTIYSLPESLFGARGEGEDWAGLDSLVSRSAMPEKYRVLELLRGTPDPAARDNRLMALASGTPWRTMVRDMFPLLRRSDYVVSYTVQPFTPEQRREVFRTRPGNLSLNELFLMAQEHEPGSDEFNELFETAARLFPDSDVANVNAAAAALERRDSLSASRYLDKVSDAARLNASSTIGDAYRHNREVLDALVSAE